jgi:hypothetical protein
MESEPFAKVRMDSLLDPKRCRGIRRKDGLSFGPPRRTVPRIMDVPAGFINGDDPAAWRMFKRVERRVARCSISSQARNIHAAQTLSLFIASVIDGGRSYDDADAVEWFARENLPPLAFRATQKVLESFYA